VTSSKLKCIQLAQLRPKPTEGKLALRGVGALFEGAAEYGMMIEPEVAAPFRRPTGRQRSACCICL